MKWQQTHNNFQLVSSHVIELCKFTDKSNNNTQKQLKMKNETGKPLLGLPSQEIDCV